MPKKYLEKNVYDAACERIAWAINHFPDFYVSFSGGKDSGVLTNLVVDIARDAGKLPVKVVFSDLEVIFQETARYVKSIMDMPEVEPYWLCIEEMDENGSSVFERYFYMWDRKKQDEWVRPMPEMPYVVTRGTADPEFLKYLTLDSVSTWSIEYFGEYLCDKLGRDSICNFIGMRTDESYGRHMAVATQKHRDKTNAYTYTKREGGYPRTNICLPIYDWSHEDIWHYYAITGKDYNRVYDAMYQAGLTWSQMRTCSAFGEEQKKSLWLWQIIEPETWSRMVSRVHGANFGKIYNHTNLNRMKIKKPDDVTWKEYTYILLNSIPEEARENFKEKFDITFRYHKVMYEEKEGLAKDVYVVDSRAEEKKRAAETGIPKKCFIVWEDFASAIIKRDFVFKKYGFGYSQKMEDRIKAIQAKWRDI